MDPVPSFLLAALPSAPIIGARFCRDARIPGRYGGRRGVPQCEPPNLASEWRRALAILPVRLFRSFLGTLRMKAGLPVGKSQFLTAAIAARNGIGHPARLQEPVSGLHLLAHHGANGRRYGTLIFDRAIEFQMRFLALSTHAIKCCRLSGKSTCANAVLKC